MVELRYSVAARSDLAEIEEYGAANFGEEASEAYMRGLAKAFDVLERYPQSAPARPDYGWGIRCRVYREHLVLHSVEGNDVLVVRVLHHSRDIKRALDE